MMTASPRYPAAQPRQGWQRRGCSMTASAPPPAAQPRPGRQRRGCSMTASERNPAAHQRPVRRRPGCSVTASARHQAAQPSLPKQMTILRYPTNASSCTLHTRAHAIVFMIVSIYRLLIAGADYIRPFLLETARLTKARPVQAVTITGKSDRDSESEPESLGWLKLQPIFKLHWPRRWSRSLASSGSSQLRLASFQVTSD